MPWVSASSPKLLRISRSTAGLSSRTMPSAIASLWYLLCCTERLCTRATTSSTSTLIFTSKTPSRSPRLMASTRCGLIWFSASEYSQYIWYTEVFCASSSPIPFTSKRPVAIKKSCTAFRFSVSCAVSSAIISEAPASASSTVGTLSVSSSQSVLTKSCARFTSSASSNSFIKSAKPCKPRSTASIPRVFFFFLKGAQISSSSASVDAFIMLS